jgi:hypothetical protein
MAKIDDTTDTGADFGPVIEPDITIPAKERPEFTSLSAEDIGIGQVDAAKIAAGLLFALDIKDQAAIIKKYVPGAEIIKDDKGKLLVQVGDNIAYINKPGFSSMDLNQMLFMVGEYVPAAKLATLGKTLIRRMGIGAAASAGTSIGGDYIANQFSDETGFSVGRGTAALIGGVVAELLAPAFSVVGKKIKERLASRTPSTLETPLPEESAILETMTPDEVTAARVAETAAKTGVIRKTIEPESAQAISDQIEFGIPYTTGQRQAQVTAAGEEGIDFAGGGTQLYEEEAMRAGARGDTAQTAMQGLAGQQDVAVRGAVESTAARLGGAVPEYEAQVGADILSDIKGAAGASERRVTAAYEDVPEQAFVEPNAFHDMMTFVDNELQGVQAQRLAKGQPELADVFLPGAQEGTQTAAAMKYLEGIAARIDEVGVAPNFGWLEEARKQLGRYIGSTLDPTDKKQLTLIKKGYDKWLDDIIDQALVTGDDTVLDALQHARTLNTAYAKQFLPQDLKDNVGRIISKMIDDEQYSGDQAINAILGASKTFKKIDGSRIVDRLKKIFGTNPVTGVFDKGRLATSEGWQNLRQAYFLRLLKAARGSDPGKPVSGTKFKQAVADLIFGDGRMIAAELFTMKELTMIRRLTRAILRTQPPRINPSGSGWVGSIEARSLLGKIAHLLGMTDMGIIAAPVIKGSKRLFGGGKVKQAIKTELPPLVTPRAAVMSQAQQNPDMIPGMPF